MHEVAPRLVARRQVRVRALERPEIVGREELEHLAVDLGRQIQQSRRMVHRELRQQVTLLGQPRDRSLPPPQCEDMNCKFGPAHPGARRPEVGRQQMSGLVRGACRAVAMVPTELTCVLAASTSMFARRPACSCTNRLFSSSASSSTLPPPLPLHAHPNSRDPAPFPATPESVAPAPARRRARSALTRAVPERRRRSR